MALVQFPVPQAVFLPSLQSEMIACQCQIPLFVSEVKFALIAFNREGALERALECVPVRLRTHERHHGGDMLVELDIAGVRAEPLMMTPFALAILLLGVQLPQFLKNAVRDPCLNHIVDPMAHDVRLLEGAFHGPAVEAANLDIEAVWISFLPRLDFCFEILGERSCELALVSNLLVAGRLVDQRNDADAGESPHQQSASLRDVCLLMMERSGFANR